MVVKKIKFWARMGQIMFFVVSFVWELFEDTQPQIIQMKYDFTPYSVILVIIGVLGLILISEAIVRLIVYSAELIAEKNNDNESFEERSKRIRNRKLP